MRLRPVALLLVLSCRFDAALETWCAGSGKCRCDAGACCVVEGAACSSEAPCCAGSCMAGICTAGSGGGGGAGGGAATGGGATGGGATGGGAAGGGIGADGGDGCTPWTCSQLPGACGYVPDGCGGWRMCGVCAGSEVCGALLPNVCSADAGEAAGSLPLPYCLPSAAAGTLPPGAPCCRDFECASGGCVGFPASSGGRRCAAPGTDAGLQGALCGDETDCTRAVGFVCNLVQFPDAGLCTSTFVGTIGDGNGCFVRAPQNQTNPCQFTGGAFCGLPGTLTGYTLGMNWPCCYDRCRDGGICDCRTVMPDGGRGTGTCECTSGTCHSLMTQYLCPF